MIKSSELRLGNWVERITNNGQHVCYEKVKYIEGGYFGKLPSSDCHPIKLTAEILERAGFIKDRNGWNMPTSQLSLTDKFYPCWFDRMLWPQDVYQFKERELRYVHQLQNLYFSLTGEELPLNF